MNWPKWFQPRAKPPSPVLSPELLEVLNHIRGCRGKLDLNTSRVVRHYYRFGDAIAQVSDEVYKITSSFEAGHWDTPANNFFVVARSGAGKTTFAKQLAWNLRDRGAQIRYVDLKDPRSNLSEFVDRCARDAMTGQLLVIVDEFHLLFQAPGVSVLADNRIDMTQPFRLSGLNVEQNLQVVCLFLTSQFSSEDELRATLRDRSRVLSGDEFERRTQGTINLPAGSLGDKFLIAASTAFNECFTRAKADSLLTLILHPKVRDISMVLKGIRARRIYSVELTKGLLTDYPYPGYPSEDLALEIRELLPHYSYGLNLLSTQGPEDKEGNPRDCAQYLRPP